MSINASGKTSSALKSALSAFKMRQPNRDLKSDSARISSVVNAIDAAIQEGVAERAGLLSRVKDIVDRPEAVLKARLRQRGTQSDLSAAEFIKAEQRLDSLAQQISNFRLLKAMALKTFPDVNERSRRGVGRN